MPTNCMRPARFQNLLAAAVNHDGRLTAATYAEAGITTSLYGLVLTGTVGANVQIVARSALGDDYSQPEHIVTDTEHPVLPLFRTMELRPDSLERYLAALIIDVAPAEFRAMYLYTERGAPVNYGCTFMFHDGSAIFMYVKPS